MSYVKWTPGSDLSRCYYKIPRYVPSRAHLTVVPFLPDQHTKPQPPDSSAPVASYVPPDGWENNTFTARQYARALGIDLFGQTGLAQIVKRIHRRVQPL